MAVGRTFKSMPKTESTGSDLLVFPFWSSASRKLVAYNEYPGIFVRFLFFSASLKPWLASPYPLVACRSTGSTGTGGRSITWVWVTIKPSGDRRL